MEQTPTKPTEQAQGEPSAKGGVQLPPNVKAVFQRLLMAAQRLIYTDSKTAQGLVEMVRGAQDPAQGVAQATGAVVNQVASQAKGIPPEVVQRIAMPVAYLIAELAVTADVVEDTPEFQKAIMSAILGSRGAPAGEQPPAEGEQQGPAGAAGGIVNEAMAGA